MSVLSSAIMPRGREFSMDKRWDVIWLSTVKGWSARRIEKYLRVSPRTTRRFRKYMRKYGEPRDCAAGRRGHVPSVMTPERDRLLVELLLDEPESTAREAFERFCDATGEEPHYSTICRALHRLQFSRKQLRGFARQRDEAAAQAFKAKIVGSFSPEQLLFIDETAKDPRDLNRMYIRSATSQTQVQPSTRHSLLIATHSPLFTMIPCCGKVGLVSPWELS